MGSGNPEKETKTGEEKNDLRTKRDRKEMEYDKRLKIEPSELTISTGEVGQSLNVGFGDISRTKIDIKG